MTEAMLLRVGADSGNAYILSPVFSEKNNEFVFLPLGDNDNGIEIEKETKVFGKKIIDFLGDEYIGKWLHIDPYFDEKGKIYTYGDRTHNIDNKKIPKKGMLLDLKPGNYLFFCSTMYEMDINDYKICKRSEIRKKQKNNQKQKHLYLFGYFKIKSVNPISSGTSTKEKERIAKLHSNNAHIIRGDHYNKNYLPNDYPEKKLILVLGDEEGSKLLKKAIKLTSCSDGRHYIEQEWLPYFEKDNFGSSRGLSQWIKNPEKFIKEIKSKL